MSYIKSQNIILKIIVLLIISVPLKAQSVYKTPSGKKYHLETCTSVRNTSEKITVREAIEFGLQPCKICKPPVSSEANISFKKPNGRGKGVRCKGLTKKGIQCKNFTCIGNGYCFHHQPN